MPSPAQISHTVHSLISAYPRCWRRTVDTTIRPSDAERRAPASAVFCALGLVVVSQALLAWNYGSLPGAQRSSWGVATVLCLSLSLPAAVLIWAVWRTSETAMSRSGIALIALAGLAMRMPYFGVGPMLEDDHFRYVLDGALVAHGLNPYAFSPKQLLEGAAPESYLQVASGGRSAIEQINFPHLRSIYPGTAQLVFAAAHAIKPWGVDGVRLLIMACEAVTALLAWKLLAYIGRPRHVIALIWCNPLLAFSLTGQAHVDAALAPPVLGALLLAHRRAGAYCGVATGLAAGVKLWPILLAPLLLRSMMADRGAAIRFVIALASATLSLSAALVFAAANPSSGLIAYARGWHINNLPYEWLSYALFRLADGPGFEPYLRSVIAIVSVTIAVAMALRPLSDISTLVSRSALVAAALFYLSPAQFPWYATWFLPLAALSGNLALLVASASLPAYFLFFPMAAPPSGDVFRFWLSGLHLLPVLAVAAFHRRGVRTVRS